MDRAVDVVHGQLSGDGTDLFYCNVPFIPAGV